MKSMTKFPALDRKRILITGARAPHALHLARALHSKGHTVLTGETTRFHISNFSNSVDKNFLVPSPRYYKDQFIDELLEIVKREEIDFLIPTWEETLYISKEKDRFPESCKVFTSDFEIVHSLHNKWLFYQMVMKHNLNSPRTQLILSEDDLKNLPFDRPFGLKSSYSRASQSVFKIDEGDELPDLVYLPSNHWIAQEWIEGDKYCSYSVCHDGHVTAHSTYPVKYAIDEKSCLTFEAIDHKEIEDWVKTLARSISYTGQMAFDFIQKPNGELNVIECNPRSTSGLYLFTPECNIDHAFFEPMTDTICPIIPTQKQIAAGMLMYGWRKFECAEGEKTFFETLKSFEDVVFSKSDMGPFVSQSWLYFYYIWKSHQLNISIPAFFTHDLDWNGDTP